MPASFRHSAYTIPNPPSKGQFNLVEPGFRHRGAPDSGDETRLSIVAAVAPPYLLRMRVLVILALAFVLALSGIASSAHQQAMVTPHKAVASGDMTLSAGTMPHQKSACTLTMNAEHKSDGTADPACKSHCIAALQTIAENHTIVRAARFSDALWMAPAFKRGVSAKAADRPPKLLL